MAILDKKLTTSGSDVEITHTNSGELLTGVIGKYIPSNTQSLLDMSTSIFSNGVNLNVSIEMPAIPVGNNLSHFEVYLSYSATFVVDGAKDQDILYHFVSTEVDGWMVERDSIYDFPGSGLNSSYVGDTVRYYAVNLDVDLDQTLYYYIRAVFFNGTVQTNDFSSFEGGVVSHYKNYNLNTSDNKISNCVIPIETSSTVWPSGKSIGFEVYIGSQPDPTNYTDNYVVYRDTFTLASGFYYFDGLTFQRVSSSGIPNTLYGNDVFFHTNSFDVSEANYVSYRAKWDTGNSEWKTKLLNCGNIE